jgi:hypothetical protein
MYSVAVTTKSHLHCQAHNRLPIDLLAPLIAIFWWFDQGRLVLPAIMKKLPI